MALGRHYWGWHFSSTKNATKIAPKQQKSPLWTRTSYDKLPWELAWSDRENGACNFMLCIVCTPQVYKYLFRSLLSILSSVYPKVELLELMVIVFNFLSSCNIVFHSNCATLSSHQQCPFYSLLAWLASPWRAWDISCLFHIIVQRTGSPLAAHLSLFNLAFIASLSLFYFVILFRGHGLEA